MEENINVSEQSTQADNMGTEAQGQSNNTGKEQKLFTQEEVNGFVQSRVTRMKAQIAKETHAEYEQKLAELNAREMKLLIKEKLDERGMSRELANIITCDDEADLNNKLDALEKIYENKDFQKEKQPNGFTIGAPSSSEDMPSADPVRKAMGLN